MAAKTKNAPKSEKVTKPVAEKESTVEKDKFGNSVSTSCAAINAVITRKPKKSAAIAEESGAKISLVRNHIQTLLRKGHVVRTDDGVKAAK